MIEKDKKEDATEKSVEFQKSLKLLKSGEVIGLPTETVYGLAGDITRPEAIEKIFRTKERPYFDPLIVHIADLAEAHNIVAKWPDLAQRLAAKFWPGPLTIVLPKRADINPMITSGLETVGLRMPRHELTRKLIRQLGHAVAAPSANKFGRTSPSTAEHVRTEFGDDLFVLDGGPCEVGLESTVIGFSADFKEIEIYRPGAITLEMLTEIAPTRTQASSASPGHLKHHYMPKVPLVVVKHLEDFGIGLYESIRQRLGLKVLYPTWMRLPPEPTLAARLLYSNMRIAAEKNPRANLIIIAYDTTSRTDGLWAAVTDRLTRAATLIS